MGQFCALGLDLKWWKELFLSYDSHQFHQFRLFDRYQLVLKDGQSCNFRVVMSSRSCGIALFCLLNTVRHGVMRQVSCVLSAWAEAKRATSARKKKGIHGRTRKLGQICSARSTSNDESCGEPKDVLRYTANELGHFLSCSAAAFTISDFSVVLEGFRFGRKCLNFTQEPAREKTPRNCVSMWKLDQRDRIACRCTLSPLTESYPPPRETPFGKLKQIWEAPRPASLWEMHPLFFAFPAKGNY